jgi:hypothetical protein
MRTMGSMCFERRERVAVHAAVEQPLHEALRVGGELGARCAAQAAANDSLLARIAIESPDQISEQRGCYRSETSPASWTRGEEAGQVRQQGVAAGQCAVEIEDGDGGVCASADLSRRSRCHTR